MTAAWIPDLLSSRTKAFPSGDAISIQPLEAVYLISGGYDLLVTLEGKTLREVAQFVSDKLSALDSVLSTKTNFILKKYKDHGTVIAKPQSDERMLVSL